MSIDEVEEMIKELQAVAPDERSPVQQRTLLLLEFYYNRYTSPQQSIDFPEPSYLEEHPVNTQVEVDLTGNGTKDKVTVEVVETDEWEFSVTLHINNIELELTPDNGLSTTIAFPAENFAIVDIDTDDDYLEIVISDNGNNYSFSHIFRFDGESIVYMGMIRGLYSTIEFPGNGEVITVTSANILQTWSITQRYTITDESALQTIIEDLYVPIYYEDKYFALMDLTLYTQRDEASSTIVMEQTSVVKFPAHDNIEWVQVALEDGQTGWFKTYNADRLGVMIVSPDGEFYADEVFFMLASAGP